MLKNRALDKYVYHVNRFILERDNLKAYEGYQQKTGQLVYVKMIPIKSNCCTGAKSPPNQIRNLLHTFSNLNNPYISKIIQATQTNNNMYIITERGNANLQQHLNHKRSQIKQLQIFTDLLIGLCQIYSKGYLHTNFVPNIIQACQKDVKIGGLSYCILQSQTKKIDKVILLKNWQSLAPQLMQGKVFSQKSLIWSLGLIFYKLLFNRHPFEFKSKQQLLWKIKSSSDSLSFVCNPLFKKILTSCLRVNHQQRFRLNDLLMLLISECGINEQFSQIIIQKINQTKTFYRIPELQHIFLTYDKIKQIQNELSYIRVLQRTIFLLEKSQSLIQDPPIAYLTQFIIKCRLYHLSKNTYWRDNKNNNKLRNQLDSLKKSIQSRQSSFATSLGNSSKYKLFKQNNYRYKQYVYLQFQAFLRQFIQKSVKNLCRTQGSIRYIQRYTIYSLDFAISLFQLNQQFINQLQNKSCKFLRQDQLNKLSQYPLNLDICQVFDNILSKVKFLKLLDVQNQT